MEWDETYSKMEQQFNEAHSAGVEVKALIEKPLLTRIETFYLEAYYKLQYRTQSDMLAFKMLNNMTDEEMSDLEFYLNRLSVHTSKAARAKTKRRK